MNIHGLKNQLKDRARLIRTLESSGGRRNDNYNTIQHIKDKMAKIRQEIKLKREQKKRGEVKKK